MRFSYFWQYEGILIPTYSFNGQNSLIKCGTLFHFHTLCRVFENYYLKFWFNNVKIKMCIVLLVWLGSITPFYKTVRIMCPTYLHLFTMCHQPLIKWQCPPFLQIRMEREWETFSKCPLSPPTRALFIGIKKCLSDTNLGIRESSVLIKDSLTICFVGTS